MKIYKRDELIDSLANETELILQKAIAEWQFIQHSRFARKPSSDGWSANECLQHLNSYGRYYLPAISKALEQLPDASTAITFTPGWLGNYFTRLMQQGQTGKLSRKMKSPKDHSPQSILESHLVISEFIDQAEKLLQLLTLARKKDLNKRKVGISIAPWINLKVGDVFMFLIAHIQRHVLQAERAMAASGSGGDTTPVVPSGATVNSLEN